MDAGDYLVEVGAVWVVVVKWGDHFNFFAININLVRGCTNLSFDNIIVSWIMGF